MIASRGCDGGGDGGGSDGCRRRACPPLPMIWTVGMPTGLRSLAAVGLGLAGLTAGRDFADVLLVGSRCFAGCAAGFCAAGRRVLILRGCG